MPNDAERLLSLAGERGLRIAVAESLTGGLLADALVAVPGASAVFSGGIVAYDTALKHSLLGVDAERLRRTGPVDAEVARRMAIGVRAACAVPRAETARGSRPEPEAMPADLGIATTGVAGPDADPQTGQPAGTVWVGASLGDSVEARLVSCAGLRPDIRRAAVEAALRLAIELLESSSR